VVALAAPGDDSTPITKPQAVAFAKAVNLQAGDLPEYLRLHTATAQPKGSEGAVGCKGAARFRPVAAEVSPTFFSPVNVVVSIVGVMKSEALAKASLAASTSGRGRSCIVRQSKENLETRAVKVTFVSVAKMLGAGAIAVRAVAEKKRLQEDGVFFRVGPALILLFTFGERSLPAATEDRLLALLHDRAEAHKL
jgi:hypothetical protein